MTQEEFREENNHLQEIDYVVKLMNTDDFMDEIIKESIEVQMNNLGAAVNKDFTTRKVIFKKRPR